MPKMLICYYSRTSHTQHMAEAIADGVREVGGIDVEVKAVADTPVESLVGYDAIILGSPVYYGSMAADLKRLLDDSVRFHGQLAGKVGGAFASSANVGGGNETTNMDIVKALMIHGMVVTGSYSGDHYGPVAINDLDDRSRKECGRYGRILAGLTVKLHG